MKFFSSPIKKFFLLFFLFSFILFFLHLLLRPHSVLAQNDLYNLNFQLRKDGFRWGCYGDFDVKNDTNSFFTLQQERVVYTKLSKEKDTIYVPLFFRLYQSVYLPEIIQGQQDCRIEFHYKSHKLNSAMLDISALDENENEIYWEKLPIHNSEEFTKIGTSFSDRRIRYLNLKITAERGELDISNEGKNIGQHICIKQFKIIVDGYDMANYESSSLPPINLDTSQIIPVSLVDSSYLKTIDALKQKRVVAVGESAHGIDEFGNINLQIIKHQVLHNNCKLVILESQMLQLIKWNLFIQDETSFGIEELEEDFYHPSIDIKSLTELILWLKEYNKQTKNKVWLMGMDYSAGDFTNVISDSFYELSKKKSIFRPLIGMFWGKSEERMLNYLGQTPAIRSYLGEGKYQLLLQSIRFKNDNFSRDELYFQRDSIMAFNVKCAIEGILKKNETAVIYAHLLHTGKKQMIVTNILGKYLSDFYGDDYFSIGLLYGKGEAKVAKIINVSESVTLEIPPSYLIENYCLNTGFDYFYLPMEAVASPLAPFRVRNIVNGEVPFFTNLRNKIDGFIFVRDIHPTVKRKEMTFMERYTLLNKRKDRTIKRCQELGIKY